MPAQIRHCRGSLPSVAIRVSSAAPAGCFVPLAANSPRSVKNRIITL